MDLFKYDFLHETHEMPVQNVIMNGMEGKILLADGDAYMKIINRHVWVSNYKVNCDHVCSKNCQNSLFKWDYNRISSTSPSYLELLFSGTPANQD